MTVFLVVLYVLVGLVVGVWQSRKFARIWGHPVGLEYVALGILAGLYWPLMVLLEIVYLYRRSYHH